MTQQVRKAYRKHPRWAWVAAVVVLSAVAMAIVLPAIASDTTNCKLNATTCVKPESTLQKVTPSIVSVGGSNFSCAVSAGGSPSGMYQFQISKPTPGEYTDPQTGVTFVVSGPTGTQDPKSFFSFSVKGSAAIVYHVGVNGGTNTAWYDYKNNRPASPAFPSGGVYADTDLHSTPDSKYKQGSFTFFTASITTFCYSTLTKTVSCEAPFSGNDLSGSTGNVLYEARLIKKGADCKSGDVVMYSYKDTDNKLFASLHPTTGVDCTVTPTPSSCYNVLERIYVTGLTGDGQNPVTIYYDDIPPYDGVADANGRGGKRLMEQCLTDPRDPGSPWDIPSTPAMPPAEGDDLTKNGPHTSCMLQSTDSAGVLSSGRTYEAWIFSSVDGFRAGG
jgi:hypothetical protein